VVHRLGFGTMQLTGPGVWGEPADHAGAIAVLRRAVALQALRGVGRASQTRERSLWSNVRILIRSGT